MHALPVFTRAALALTLGAALAGCQVTESLSWRYTLDAPLGEREVLIARISFGDDCSESDNIAFERSVGGELLTPPPLESGDYCFSILVEDRDSCMLTRGSRVPVILEDRLRGGGVNIVNEVEPFATPVACEATCVPGAGCLRCPSGGLDLCPDNQYCCDLIGFCATPGLFEAEGDCVRIR